MRPSHIPRGIIIQTAAQGLRSRAGRTLLSCLSLVLGVLAILIVDVASTTAERVILRPAELQHGLEGTWALKADGSAQSLQAADHLVHHGQGTAALLATENGAALTNPDGAQVSVTAFSGPLLQIRPFRIESGRWPTDHDQLIPTIALNKAAARFGALTLRPTSGSVPLPVAVVALIDDGDDTPHAWLPLTQLRARAGANPSTILQVLARNPRGTDDAAHRLTAAATTYGLRTDGGAVRVDTIETLTNTLHSTRTIFLIIGGVTLLVGVIGVLNIGLATLKERAEELALRRSLGATRRDVALLVLTESVLVGVLGAAVATCLSWAAFTMALPLVVGGLDTGPFPLRACLVGLAVGALAGLAGGAVPALRAARLPIALVMRA
ncbi:ABC transporter permease [Streptomyces sp. H39-C1]|uniref:ABC transporter permease n=1 Tax=Streptomyces sp. H39-C1 TaxID=3004355 RepID=UPI0022AED7F0|nr:ABC transporter permease [Streptomyces sp. H39-C1]MCZ4101160.1 ABC transporter permease [Streptomyces sp. H39-C1]